MAYPKHFKYLRNLWVLPLRRVLRPRSLFMMNGRQINVELKCKKEHWKLTAHRINIGVYINNFELHVV